VELVGRKNYDVMTISIGTLGTDVNPVQGFRSIGQKMTEAEIYQCVIK
jgi:hypothetical protein